MNKIVKLLVISVLVGTYAYSQSNVRKVSTGIDIANEPTPISIVDPQIQQRIRESYNAIVSANKDFQIAILDAKVEYKIPKDWEINLSTLVFYPPKPKVEEVKKEEKKP